MATSANANHPMTTMDRCRMLGEMAYNCAIAIGSMVLVIYVVECFGGFLRAAPRPRELVNLWDLLVVMLPAYAFMVTACYQSFKLAHYIARVVLTTSFTTGSRKILLVIAAFAFSRALSEPSGGIFGIFPTPHFVEGMSSVRVIQALYLRDVLGHTTYVLGLFVLALSVALILYMIGARKVAASRARWRAPQGDVKVDIEAANDVVEK